MTNEIRPEVLNLSLDICANEFRRYDTPSAVAQAIQNYADQYAQNLKYENGALYIKITEIENERVKYALECMENFKAEIIATYDNEQDTACFNNIDLKQFLK